ncbi:MAG TPA: hypothetical protein PKE05_14420 [Microthrixaceae bacterium]|nr:hypothetical protein [Microthrixaceae bacterium]
MLDVFGSGVDVVVGQHSAGGGDAGLRPGHGSSALVEQVVSLLSYRYPDQGRRRPSNFAAALSFLAWRRA